MAQSVKARKPMPANKRESKEKALMELQALEYEKSDRNYGYFFKCAWPILEPKTELLSNWHQDLIAEYLTACYLRQIKRLIINIPPRYSKSLEVSVTFPAWVWTKQPEERFLFTSYSSGLSTKHSVDRRNVIESPWYQAKWGCRCGKFPHDEKCKGFRMATDQNVKTEFANDRRGHMIATSMSGTATGKGGNFLIVDDPHDTSRAHSDIKRQADIENFDQKFTTRLDDKMNGVIIIVMQRLHENDLTGHCIAQGGWEHLCIEGVATEAKTIYFPLTGRAVSRAEGDLLHPEREGKKEIAQQRKALGAYGFEAQYQQSPSPREGGIFKKAYWRYYNSVPQVWDDIIDSWDFTFKGQEDSDYVSGTVWGIKGANRYLLHHTFEKMGFLDSLKAIRKHRELFPAISRTLVEDKANGSAIIETMQSEISGIIPFMPHGSKMERAAAVEPQLESHNVYLPVKDLATFDVQAYVDCLAKFPAGKHDDPVDSTTMALLYLKQSLVGIGEVAQAAKDVEESPDALSTQADWGVVE